MARMFSLFLLALSVLSSPAVALDAASVPTRFPTSWGVSAGASYIRNIPASSAGLPNCAASLEQGFPPLTFTPSSAGGCPPFGQDMNGILRQITLWSRWQGAGGPVKWDSSFNSSIGGYPAGTILAQASSPGCYWVNLVDNNASNPDASGANWFPSCPGNGIAGTSTGSANSQLVTTVGPVATATYISISFTAGFTNTGFLQVNLNGTGLLGVYRHSQLGATPTVGGEVVAGQRVTLQYDGTRWQCQTCATATVGEIKDYAGSTAPTGWAFIDGSCVSQTTYADLFAVTSTVYGSCSAGNFALPDGRGRALFAQDTQGTQGAASRLTTGGGGCNGAVIGTGCGVQFVTVNQANLPVVTLATTITPSTLATTLTPSSLPTTLTPSTLTTTIGAGQGSHVHDLQIAFDKQLGPNGSGSAEGPIGAPTNNTAAAVLPAMTGSTPLTGSGTTALTGAGTTPLSGAGTTPLGGSGTNLLPVPPLQVVTKIIKF